MSGGEVLLRITISGAPGSGTSTLVGKIQHTTGWSSLNGGDVFEQKPNVEILPLVNLVNYAKKTWMLIAH